MTHTQRTGQRAMRGAEERPVVPGVDWPVPPFALAALTDMGMSDDLIARYFGISSSEVRIERERTPR